MINFLNRFRKSKSGDQPTNPSLDMVCTDTLEVSENKYPDIVHQIHEEFYSAGEKVLNEALKILDLSSKESRNKNKLLMELGFSGTNDVLLEKQLQEHEKLTSMITTYNLKCPNYKFILEKDVETICKKYKLYLGNISSFKGFVPLDKANEIKIFKDHIKNIEVCNAKCSKSTYGDDIGKIYMDNGQRTSEYKGIYTTVYQPLELKICAPLKDMDIKSYEYINNYKIENKPTPPDPVVLQPVDGGYLIVCAWGDEASDELIVNEKFN